MFSENYSRNDSISKRANSVLGVQPNDGVQGFRSPKVYGEDIDFEESQPKLNRIQSMEGMNPYSTKTDFRKVSLGGLLGLPAELMK